MVPKWSASRLNGTNKSSSRSRRLNRQVNVVLAITQHLVGYINIASRILQVSRTAQRMAPRSSTRASARPSSRREASSPPKHSSYHQSHSHVGRRTRSTRSQSIDVDGGDIEVHASNEVASRHLVSVENEDGLDDSANKLSRRNNQRSRKSLAAEPSPG